MTSWERVLISLTLFAELDKTLVNLFSQLTVSLSITATVFERWQMEDSVSIYINMWGLRRREIWTLGLFCWYVSIFFNPSLRNSWHWIVRNILVYSWVEAIAEFVLSVRYMVSFHVSVWVDSCNLLIFFNPSLRNSWHLIVCNILVYRQLQNLFLALDLFTFQFGLIVVICTILLIYF